MGVGDLNLPSAEARMDEMGSLENLTMGSRGSERAMECWARKGEGTTDLGAATLETTGAAGEESSTTAGGEPGTGTGVDSFTTVFTISTTGSAFLLFLSFLTAPGGRLADLTFLSGEATGMSSSVARRAAATSAGVRTGAISGRIGASFILGFFAFFGCAGRSSQSWSMSPPSAPSSTGAAALRFFLGRSKGEGSDRAGGLARAFSSALALRAFSACRLNTGGILGEEV